MKFIKKHAAEFRKALLDGDYEVSDGGILFIKQGVRASGMYFHTVNGEDYREDKNLLPDAGLTHILNVYLGATAKLAAWYLGLYSGAVSPAANWTAANFASTASEITSNTEGYSETTRRQWTPTAATTPAIDNLAAKAAFTVNCTTSITVNGAGLISDNVKGGTSGVLVSAARFATARTLFDDDIFELGYRVTLTG